jgi:hypothetical protein
LDGSEINTAQTFRAMFYRSQVHNVTHVPVHSLPLAALWVRGPLKASGSGDWPAYLTSERIAKAKKLKLAVTAGFGFDYVGLEAAIKNGITVAGVTYSNSISVSGWSWRHQTRDSAWIRNGSRTIREIHLRRKCEPGCLEVFVLGCTTKFARSHLKTRNF